MTMVDIDTLVQTTGLPERLFSLHDRCDRCGFQSYYVAQKLINGQIAELLLCKHHGERHALALDFHGWLLHDFTIHLTPPPIVDNT